MWSDVLGAVERDVSLAVAAGVGSPTIEVTPTFRRVLATNGAVAVLLWHAMGEGELGEGGAA
jgi:hypothetical protein